MKKYVTPFAAALLAMGFSAQNADAQRFYERLADDGIATEVKPGTDYLLQNPWSTDYYYLSGVTAINNPEEHAIYNFEVVGEDADGNLTYRLKQKVTGLYLENPDLTNGQLGMTASQARAFVFTALPGVPVKTRVEDTNGDGQINDSDDVNPEWTNGDVRQIYEPMDSNFENVFVFCNVNYASSQYDVFEIFHNGFGPMWTQYTNARIFHLYEAKKSKAIDDVVNLFMYGYYPSEEDAVKNLFVSGEAPGQVPAEKVEAFTKAWEKVFKMQDDYEAADQVVYDAIDELSAAKQACVDGVNPVKEGFYVIDNNPAGGRAALAKTANACLYEKDGSLYWSGFDKPEVMNVESAAYIWEVKKAGETAEDGWYLRNYGTDRYAGGLNRNFLAVPSTAGAEQVFDINHRSADCFSIDMRGQNDVFPSLHADANPGYKIVIWTADGTPSQWRFLPVNESDLKGIEGELEQNRINNEAKGLIEVAKKDYEKGFTYASEGMTRDGVFGEVNGLVTDAAGEGEEGGQLYCNKPEDPAHEGNHNCYRNLIDGDLQTYFHTQWSGSNPNNEFHYLDVTLNEAVECFNIKYAQRHNNSSGSPVKIRVLASNDTTNGNWKDQGFMYCEYPYTCDVAGVNKANFAGIANKTLDGAYKYVRLQVEGTLANGKSNGHLFWYWSEFRMYKAVYDPSISLINAVPATIRSAFETQLKNIQDLLAEKKVTKEALEAFKKAYKDFLDNYPDPQIVKNLLAEAKAQAEAAEEGDGLGYFAGGAKADLEKALTEVEGAVKPLMTVAEVKAAKEKIETALAAFNAKLNVPADGAYYFIKCATGSTAEGSAAEQYLRAMDNDESQVKYFLPSDMGVYIHHIWKAIKHDDGTYSFQNCGTGTYLGNPKANDVKVNMSFDADTLSLRSAKVPGIFNLVCAENIFCNAKPGTGELVTWGSASGLDNSAFILEPVESVWDESSIQLDMAKSGLQIISVPFQFKGAGSDIYKVAGMKDGKLQLALYGSDELVPAGTPFFANIEEAEEGYAPTITLYAEGGLDEFTYNLEGVTQNGLKAAIHSVKDIAGAGIFFGGKVITAVAEDAVHANSGYFVSMPTAVETDGALAIEFPETIETGISDIVLVPAKGAKSGVYTLTGVKLSNSNKANNLPKGLYIIGGEKVLVK